MKHGVMKVKTTTAAFRRPILAAVVSLSLLPGGVRADDELDMSFIQGGSSMNREAWAALNSGYAPGRYLVDLFLN